MMPIFGLPLWTDCNCETQPPVSIGLVALFSLIGCLAVPHPWHLLSFPLYYVSDYAKHVFFVMIWSWQHVSINISYIHCWVKPRLLLSSSCAVLFYFSQTICESFLCWNLTLFFANISNSCVDPAALTYCGRVFVSGEILQVLILLTIFFIIPIYHILYRRWKLAD